MLFRRKYIFNLDLNSEQLLVMSVAGEFQTVGAEQEEQEARSAKCTVAVPCSRSTNMTSNDP